MQLSVTAVVEFIGRNRNRIVTIADAAGDCDGGAVLAADDRLTLQLFLRELRGNVDDLNLFEVIGPRHRILVLTATDQDRKRQKRTNQ